MKRLINQFTNRTRIKNERTLKKDETRRDFIKNVAVGGISIGAMIALSPSKALSTMADNNNEPGIFKPPKVPIIDMHEHCFAGPSDPRFPYNERATYKPTKIALPEHLLECMNRAGVDFAVIVSPEPYQDDHRFLEHCLEVGRGRFKGTILVFADRPGSMGKLPQLAKRGDIIAVRIHAYLPDRLPPFGKPELRQLWKLAADNGLAVQLHFEPRYAAGFEPLIKEFKDTPVIIDHLGRPLNARSPQEYSIVERWGDLPNTIIKLSHLGTVYDHPSPVMRPYVNQMISAYGLERMIYGGGFNSEATGESYKAFLNYARSFISKFSEEDQSAVLGGNASRLLCRGW